MVDATINSSNFPAGTMMQRLTPDHRELGIREGFLVVTLTWLVAAAMGALPYIFSSEPQVDGIVDAYFESMSGFTTTGASVLTDIEALPRSLLIWRSLTQWLGGIGFVVLALAVLPKLAVGGQQLMDVEAPGPETEKLTPRIAETARRLWVVYLGLTAAELAILLAIGYGGLSPQMDFFNALAHTFATISTGGFSPNARSVEPFGAEAQWVISVFMLLGAVNFALMFRAVRRPRVLRHDEELRVFLLVIAAATALVAVELLTYDDMGLHDAIRHAAFQVARSSRPPGLRVPTSPFGRHCLC